MDAVYKRSIDDIFLRNSSDSLNGCWIRESCVSVKLLYLTASTAAVTPGTDAEGGGASAGIEVDMDWPAVGSHCIIEIVLQLRGNLRW